MSRQDLKERNFRLLYRVSGFALPVLGMLLILFSRHFYPFGENTLFTMDMQSQYAEFFSSLRDLAGGSNSLFCCWSRSLGGNYMGLFAYYLANPLSFLVILFPTEKLYLGILLLTLVKFGLCGLSFAEFSFYHWNATPEKRWRKLYFLLILSTSYALMSYNLVYSQALMWLDGVIFLPLILLGIEKLLNEKKKLFLILMLAGSFFCNYYTGYMNGIFALLYLIFRLSYSDKEKGIPAKLQKIAQFLLCAFWAAGLCAVLLLPAFLDLFSGKMSGIRVDADGFFGFSLWGFVTKLVCGSYSSPTYSNLPNVYCGFTAFFMAIAFFTQKKRMLSEKISAAILLPVLFWGMQLSGLNALWHGFTQPNSYPFRQSYLFSFMILFLAMRAGLEWRRVKGYALAGLILFAALDILWNGRSILYSLENEYDYDTVSDYENYLVTTAPLAAELKQDTGFFRVNALYEYSKNDSMLWGYPGVSHYSSTYNRSVNDFTRKLGMSCDWLWNAGYGATPLTDSFLSVKYVLARYPLPDSYKIISKSGYGTASYRNSLRLPIAYSIPVPGDGPVFSDNVFENQNALLKNISGEDKNFFKRVVFWEDRSDCLYRIRFAADGVNPYYLYIPSDAYTYAEVFVNGQFTGNAFSSESKSCLYLGTFPGEQEVTLEVRLSAPIETGKTLIYHLDLEQLSSTLFDLRKEGVRITSHRNGTIKGTIHISDGRCILTGIPYDPGWHIRIDNQKVPAQKYADTFLMIPVEEGTHHLVMTYISPGFGAGALISLCSLALTVALFFRERKAQSL